MKMKSTLWALAFACAAVSCSDDFEDPNKGGNGNGANGETTFVKVAVNTGVTTKANAGEDGDIDNGEVGLEAEYKVDDVTVILYKLLDGTSPSTAFTSTSTLVAAGYAETSGNMSDGTDWHKKYTTVSVQLTEEEADDFDGNTYGLITVTNWGSSGLKDAIVAETPELDTATELASYLVRKTNTSGQKFVMSSHIDAGETVKLQANTTAESAPEAEVHVERLAAKVRLNPTLDGTDAPTNFIFTTGTGDEEAKIRLDKVSLVNELSSGSYLLKRVTSEIATGAAIPEVSGDDWLADELGATTAAKNYVIDPWTRDKSLAKVEAINTVTVATDLYKPTSDTGDKTLTYAKAFTGDNYAALWGTLASNSIALAQATDEDILEAAVTLGYPSENTTSAAASLNGYSTGALFQATYLPKKWSAVNAAGDGVESAFIDYNGDGIGEEADFTGIDGGTSFGTGFKGFYVYQGNIYKDEIAIFNESVWGSQKELDGVTSAVIYNYDTFKGIAITQLSKETFSKHLLAGKTDPFGYLAYLKTVTDAGITGNFAEENSIENYLGLAENSTANANAYKNVTFYPGGLCYYPYWIKHADNGKPTEMGIMEFGIVRNNIYDMTVTGIKGLGLSGTDKPEPKDPDEKKTFYFNVKINVKNWVVRTNGNIIL